MVVAVGAETDPSACHPLDKSMVGGVLFVSGKSAEGFKAAVAKDTEPLVKLGKINPQESSDVFWAVASSNSQDSSETLVETPIKRFLTSSFDFLALLGG
jgi:hypothetical protein